MWYNFIVLNLYYLVVKELKFIKNNNGDLSFKSLKLFYYQDCKVELLVDIENLKEKLFTRLDPKLKVQIQRRGITILQNSYTGFYTEYKFKDKLKTI